MGTNKKKYSVEEIADITVGVINTTIEDAEKFSKMSLVEKASTLIHIALSLTTYLDRKNTRNLGGEGINIEQITTLVEEELQEISE